MRFKDKVTIGNCTLYLADCADVIPSIDTVDLVFADPPYVLGTRTDGYQNYRHELEDDEHRELLDEMRSVEGAVIISGYPSEIYDEMLGDWRRIDRESVVQRGSKRTECLWLNEKADVQDLFSRRTAA